ncbi:MAG: DUF302 domain-containing protein [Geothermobacteraceae bacterium]
MSYHLSRRLKSSMEDAEERVKEKLAEEGFGVLTRIDVQATLKKKLDADIDPYVILGACNPRYAHQALQLEPHIGTMLPCNVIIRQLAAGKVEVSAVDPMASMQAIDNPKLRAVARMVRERLERVVEAL